MKKFNLLIVMLFAVVVSQAQVALSEAATAYLTEGDRQNIEASNSFFQKAKDLLSQAEAIDSKYEKYNNNKKRKKWEKKTYEAKQARVEAALASASGYAKFFDVYKRIIGEGQFFFEDDRSFAQEYMERAETSFKKANRNLSTYAGLAASQYKKTAYDKVQRDLKKAEEEFMACFGAMEEAVVLLSEQQTKKDAEDRDNTAWRNAERQHSIDGYRNYIASFPDGRYVEDARQSIAQLETDQREAAENLITYRVQILADENIWTRDKVAAIYPKVPENAIIEYFDDKDSYYKYSTGEFKSYREAAAYRDQLKTNRKDVFVVAFQRGSLMDIVEARRSTNELDGAE